ncbi:hypothetical protein ACVWW5_007001 [Bradyrhizobium sp. LM3.4]
MPKKAGDRTASEARIYLDNRNTTLVKPQLDMSWSLHMAQGLYGAKRFICDLRAQPRRDWCWYIVSDLDEMRKGPKMFARHTDDVAIENLDGILLACNIRHKKGTSLHRTATHVIRGDKELAQSCNCICLGFHEGDPHAASTADRLGDCR